MAEIIVTVSPKGESTVSVNGVSGSGCKALSAAIEKALGTVTDTELTTEYYQESQNQDLAAGQK